MTYPYAYATNVASDSATVGFQAETVHGDVYSYVIGPDAPAEKKYEVGVNYLNGGVPSSALPLIEQAIAEGHDSSEVQFYRLLALISGRTSRQFSPEDTARLDNLRRHPVVHRIDPWADGVRAVLQLLDSLRLPKTDPVPFIQAVDHLHPCQQGPVLRHITVFLQGPLGDQVWRLEVEAAKAGQCAKERGRRVGLFFHPSPAKPRVRPSAPALTSSWDGAIAFTAAVVFVIALIGIGLDLILHGSIFGMPGYVVGCAGGCLVAANWAELSWQARRRAEYERLLAPATHAAAPADGFAARVDQRFDHYLWLYAPDKEDRQGWLAATRGIRNQLRDEIAEIYRERRIRAEQLDWLIRHEVSELAHRWRRGTLYPPPDEFRAKPRARTARAAGMTASVLGGLIAALAVLRINPVSGIFVLVILAVSGYHGTRRWTGMAMERRRAAADEAESLRKFAERQTAYQKWVDKLENPKPTDQEMAEWLDCDKKVLLERALQYYSLNRSDLISYAFLETPGSPYKRASVRNGPWRYTQYKIVIFLLTGDGIRQIAFDLKIEDGEFQQRQWRSYRYEAIAFVHASVPKDGYQLTFDLNLMNGETISFRVAEPVTQWRPEEGDAGSLANATQDTTGLRNTLRVLEGVVADGKEWIARETQLQDA